MNRQTKPHFPPGGPGVAPGKSGVAPDFVGQYPLPEQCGRPGVITSPSGFGRDARNNRPEARATQPISLRRLSFKMALLALLLIMTSCEATTNETTNPMTFPLQRTEAEWRKLLTPEQYHVLREAGTERPFTGKYWDTKTSGDYRCAACGEILFTSDAKFDSGCGWPSFSQIAAQKKVIARVDHSHGMERTEVLCANCGSHLGHVFEDGPAPTGLRYCINSASIDLGTNAPVWKTGEKK